MHRSRARKRATPARDWVPSPRLDAFRTYERARRLGVPLTEILRRLQAAGGIGSTGDRIETWDLAKLASVCADLLAEAEAKDASGRAS